MNRPLPMAPPTRRHRLVKEGQAFLALAAYLAVFLGAITNYRRLVLAEAGVPYLHYGIGVLQALVTAKVLLMAKMLRLDRWLHGLTGWLGVVVISGLGSGLVILLVLLERCIEGWIHLGSLRASLGKLTSLHWEELLAQMLILFLALLPLMAFRVVSQAIGPAQLRRIFLTPAPWRP